MASLLLYRLFFRNKSKFTLPPGQKPLPIVGNIRDLPSPGTPDFRHWLLFEEKYGPISSAPLLGRTLVIIQHKEAAVEYLGKNSSKTSSRPQFEFANMCGYGTMLAFIDYSDLDRVQRVLMRIFKDFKSLFQHIKTEAAATILKVVYGYNPEPFGADPLMRIIDDILPALKRLPDWMPGAGFKRLAREWLALTDASACIRTIMLRSKWSMTLVGTDRLPTCRRQDRPNLPYINAFMKEILRWFTVAPVNIAHKNDKEIISEATAFQRFSHDPTTYANPMAFDPDRYLAPRNEPDPIGPFGYGRRICPGRFFAQENLFITVSQTLAAFKITHAIDENGKPIEVVLKHTPGLVDRPQGFPYSTVPRNKNCVELLKRLEVESPWEESNAEDLEWGSFTEYQEEHRRSVAERRSKVSN
ncbi:cytochrome P450 [Trichoderma compactum]